MSESLYRIISISPPCSRLPPLSSTFARLSSTLAQLSSAQHPLSTYSLAPSSRRNGFQAPFFYIPLSLSTPISMKSSTPVYSPSACMALRAAQGGYPDLSSLPDGVTSPTRLTAQIDAADRAFFRNGMFCDGAHQAEYGEEHHPLLLAFKRENPGASGEQVRKEFLALLRQDLYDVVHGLTNQTAYY